MAFWSTLFGKSKEVAASSPTPVHDLIPRWGEIEVQGESFRRDAVRRLFDELGLPEGGVTQQAAHLVPEPLNQYDRNAVKVVIGGWHIGYVPNEISAEVAAVLDGGQGVAPVRVWADPKDGTWRARATLFPSAVEPDRDFAQEQRAVVHVPDDREIIPPTTLTVSEPMDLRLLDSTRMRIKGIGNYVGWNERRAVGGTTYVLVREPDNPHDSCAVLVLSNARKVGYVSAARAKILAPLFDNLGSDGYLVGGTGPSDESVQLWVDIPKADVLRAFVKSRLS
ncbi:HIRAN domain-containing protein [Microbacterium sp. LWS13-1.2]|uniref:HIRAN domain-containing protein n=1 Tax=Microbacterium sp. LWS13-1.2 TaxID=3135264 RepID=A0AAU6SEV7_9MICO